MAAKTKTNRTKKGDSRLTRELLETARGMRASGIMTKSTCDKITLRHMAKARLLRPRR